MERPSPKPRRRVRKADAAYLERAALHYLQRFASSAENLRRVLLRRVERSAREHGTDREEGARLVDALVGRLQASGMVDDRVYAEGRALSLARRGTAPRMIRARLAQKGVVAAAIDGALAHLAERHADPELAAALALARRRRLGPYRIAERAAHRDRDLAALARAGFPYDVARRLVEAESPEALEAGAAGSGLEL
ncbi:MAG: RecX family transcriptional regulator [Inquilinus sp.]|nr:RecX family transcriptional regulator [Inquilinus sp.]